MTISTRLKLVLVALALASAPAFAGVPISDIPNNAKASYVQLPDGTWAPAQADSSGNATISGSISASLAGFNATAGQSKDLAVTGTSADTTLPTGADVVITNTGTVDVRFRMQAGAGTAVVTDQILKAGAAVGQHITTQTHISAITSSGSSSINVQGGVGLATGYGGSPAAGTGGDASAANQAAVIGTKAPGTAAANSQLVGGVYNSTAPTLTNGQQAAHQLTAKGEMTSHDADLLAAANAGTAAPGAATPASALYVGANSGGLLVGLIQADVSVPISISTATDTQLIALSSGKKIYVTAWDVAAAGTGNFQLEYGTGTNCGTGTTALTGNYNFTAQSGISKGNGLGVILVVPAGNALCAKSSAAVGMAGSVSATQF